MRALSRVVARPGIPEAPGRARLLTFPRPVTSRPPVRRRGPGSDFVALGALCLACGALLGWGIRTQDVLVERAGRLQARETAERLSAHSDYLACEYVRGAQVVRRVPGFEGFVREAEVLGEQLAPEVLERCRGAR